MSLSLLLLEIKTTEMPNCIYLMITKQVWPILRSWYLVNPSAFYLCAKLDISLCLKKTTKVTATQNPLTAKLSLLPESCDHFGYRQTAVKAIVNS